MSGNGNNPALLPKGFADLLPPEAEGEARSILTLMKLFKTFGYERVKPPLVEFEDSLIAPGPGVRYSTDTFRVMDPLSHRMLGLRSDLTAQIARLVTTRFDECEMPIRLTYAGDVLRTKGSQLRTDRQFCQVGCELVTEAPCMNADIEICMLSVLGLRALGIGDITVDLNIPHFVGKLLAGLPENQVNTLREAISRRDQAGIQSSGLKYAKEVITLMAENGDAPKVLSVLEKLAKKLGIVKEVAHMKGFYVGLVKTLEDYGVNDMAVSLDVLEQNGFEYHNTLGFTLFSSQVHGELGRGGAYDIHFRHQNVTKIGHGFTLYMDTIGKTYTYVSSRKKIFVPFTASWKDIKELQDDNWAVIRALGKNDKAPEDCCHVLKNGKVMPLE